MAEMTTQLAVFLKNVPGALKELLSTLSEASINIEGLMVNDAADHAVVRLVVDVPGKALHLLGERGAVVVESEIIVHEMPNRPGELLVLAGELARHRININYLYGSTPREGGKPRIFIHTEDDKTVFRLLAEAGGRAAGGGKAAGGKAGGRTESSTGRASRGRAPESK